MAYETYPKNGKTGSRHVFSGETHMDSWAWRDGREKRDGYKRSGRAEFAGKAQSSEKFQVGKESPGNTSKREYPKSGHKGAKFGSVKKQGNH